MKKEDLEESKIDEVDEVKDIDDFDLDEEAYDEADETVEDTEEAEEEPKKEDKKEESKKDKKKEEKKETKKEKPEKKKDDSSSNNLQKVIILLVLALICCGLIFVAVFLSNKDKNKNSASANEVSGDTVENTLTLEECQANVENGTMLELTTESGATVYVYNYTNEDYINENIAVTDEEIDQMINDYILSGYSKLVSANHADVRTGDVANIDYLGKIDGVAFDGGTGQGYNLEIGSGSFIDGFEDQLIGMQAGESKDITVTFPEDYYEELAGKEAVFTVSVNSISVNEVPSKLTDEIAAEYSADAGRPEFNTAKKLRDFIVDREKKEKLSSLIFENYYVSDIDENIVAAYEQEFNTYMNSQATAASLELEDYISYYGMTMDDFNDYSHSMALDSAKLTVFVEAIAAKEGLTVDDNDILTVVTTLGYEDLESYNKDFGEDDPCLKYYAMQDKVMAYIYGLYGLSME